MFGRKKAAERDRLRIVALEDRLEEAQDLAGSQLRNATRLTKAVNAYRTVVIEHIRACQMFPENEQLQRLTVALITELDVAGLNVSAEVRVVPKASRP